MTGDALDRLAALAGIEDGWWDFFGKYRLVRHDTKRAFLTAMGFAVETPAQVAASLAELEAKPWLRPLPPVLVTDEAAGRPVIQLTLAERHCRQAVQWAVEEEDGTLHTGSFLPADLPLVEEMRVEGELRRRLMLELPGTPLPGQHRFTIASGSRLSAEMALIVAPSHAHWPREPGRLWGFATQLYALNRAANWGVGDFTDLARLGRRAAAAGAAAIGVNPLHALFANLPDRYSPYSPSSRVFLDVVYIDVEAVPEFTTSQAAQQLFAQPDIQRRLAAARSAELIDYPVVGALKRQVLEPCWQRLKDPECGGRLAAFRAFQERGGRKAERFAVFEALQEFFLQGPAPQTYWRMWPAAFQDPDGPAVARFADERRDRVEFFWYLQWLAEEQLAAAQGACRDAGMPLGIYRDLGVGIAEDGAEAWANQRLLCLGVSVGAPPDPLNLAGQDWGLVPFNPLTIQEAAYQPLLDVLQANMANAGAMRLDHAMSLQRLYWVPRGAAADQGAYVRYPVADLFRLVVLASARHRCVVIGEDLGTVPDGFRERMATAGILGYRLLVFEQTGERFKTPEELPDQALVTFGTHDLPSLAGWWEGIDIAQRCRLDLYPDPAMGDAEDAERKQSRGRLVAALVAAGLLDRRFPTAGKLTTVQVKRLARAVYAYLARSRARLLMVQFEDLLGLSTQMNLPGTVDQHPNWRLRLPMSIEAMFDDSGVRAVVEDLETF